MSYSGKFKDKNNNLHPVTSVLYGTCDTAAATAAKVVTCTDFDTLMTGVTIRVKFANANTAASPTVNINSTGAKSVYRFGSTAPVDGNSWNAGEVVELVYDGTSFFMTGADDIAAKQNVTDNSLDTEAKTIVGAINEHEGDISTLKSGLTDLSEEVNGDATTYPYADVITIPDAIPANVADCNVKIEPVQDLHGYDKPWVGGAGKNKLPLTVDGIKEANTGGTWSGNTYTYNDVTFTVNTDNDGNVTSVKVNGTASQNVTLLIVFVGTASTDYYISGCPANGGSNTYYFDTFGDGVPRVADYGSGATFTASGNSQWVRIGVQQGYNAQNLMFYPMIRLSTETDATFAPYTNYCPISGHTEASVQRVGKNLFDKNSADIQPWYIGGTDNKIGYNANTRSIIIPCKPSTTYTISKTAGTTLRAASIESASYAEFTQTEGYVANNTGSSLTITTTTNAQYLITTVRGSDDTVSVDDMINSVQIELGSTATPYAPYAGKTYTIALGDTIYGGTVDFDSGVMKVDRGMLVIDENTQNMSLHNTSDSTAVFKIITGQECVNDARQKSNMFTHDTNGWNSDIAKPCFVMGQEGNLYIQVPLTVASTVSAFTTWLASNNVQIFYPLKDADITTIQLTPQQIQLLKGTNTLTASTGQISVTANGVSGSIGAVQEQVNDIAEDVETITSVKSATAGTNVTIDGGGYITVGNMVIVNIEFTADDNIASNTVLLNLPNELLTNTPINIYDKSTYDMLSKGRIYNGKLMASEQIVSSNSYYAAGVYIKS